MTLVYESRAGLGLGTALAEVHAAAGLVGAVALLASPDHYLVGRVEAHTPGTPRPADARGRPLDLEGVFDARVFTPERELRWTRTEAGGTALLLSESGVGLAGWERIELEAEPLGPTTYLLLGELERAAGAGWSRLSSGRTRPIEVPVAATARRLLLRALEYVAVDPEHGNAYVCEERLLELAPAPEPGRGDEA
jgi:CRISPR-associated protein (TIGR03984 family)